MAHSGNEAPIFEGSLEERELIGLPSNYLPQAPGVLFAGRKMLRYAGCVAGRCCPSGWERVERGYFIKYLGDYRLMVSQFGRVRDRRFAVERMDFVTDEQQALTFAFQHVPVWAHTRREAMFLAEHYIRPAALHLVGCCWTKVR
ncbi:hypothetical protein [Bradyrhizobium sp. USDA 4504]